MKLRRAALFIISAIVLVLFLAACQPPSDPAPAPAAQEQAASQPAEPSPTPAPSATPPPSPTVEPSPTATQPPTETPAPTPVPGLPPEPVEIAFSAADGASLNGRYYPAAALDAPLVILMHWVAGDFNDWNEVAPWLQNRGLKNPYPNPAGAPWWEPSWFPPIPPERSFGVFTFSYRSCQPFQTGCTKHEPQAWMLDVQAAMRTARELEGTDPQRIVTIGSSIGADGAPNGCDWLNQEYGGGCLGSISLSPGDYMGAPYKQVVKALAEFQPPAKALCLADESEVGFCKAAGEHPTYQVVTVPGGGHGNNLISPNLEPLPLQVILDFLIEITAGVKTPAK